MLEALSLAVWSHMTTVLPASSLSWLLPCSSAPFWAFDWLTEADGDPGWLSVRWTTVTCGWPGCREEAGLISNCMVRGFGMGGTWGQAVCVLERVCVFFSVVVCVVCVSRLVCVSGVCVSVVVCVFVAVCVSAVMCVCVAE